MTPEWPESHRTHKHGSGQMAPYRVLSSESVVVVVGNYKFVTGIYEIGHHLGMLLKLLELRRIQIAPPEPPIIQAKCKKIHRSGRI